MPYELENHSIGALGAASHHFDLSIETALTTTEAFRFITDIDRDGEWFPDFIDGAWTSAPPHGSGSVRWFKSKDLWLEERVVAWEPGARFAFVGLRTTLPVVRRFAEDYRFFARSEGGCRIAWTVHYTPRTLFMPLHPILRPYFGRSFRIAAKNLTVALDRCAATRAGAQSAA